MLLLLVYLWVSENDVSAILTGFGGINLRNEVKKCSNIRFKTVIFSRQKSEDLDSDELGKSSRIRTRTRNP